MIHFNYIIRSRSMFAARIIFFTVLFFMNCNAMDKATHVQAYRDFATKTLLYTTFFSSTNEKEVILENYAKAVQACKDALKKLAKRDGVTTSRRRGGDTCTLSPVEAKSLWQRQLDCLTNEETLRQ
ncbi:MAG: hypothetical protein LBD81_03420, partial [Holosporaceae bacterium]|nr:hypothetical protein [Holosporaceae bacterium]